MVQTRTQATAVAFLALSMIGCSSTGTTTTSASNGPPPSLNDELFTQDIHVSDEGEIFALTDAQIDALEQFLSRSEKDEEPHWQLARFIDGHLSDFDYYGKTLAASQALQDERGNCLSLAVVTAAYARHLGLEHDFQLMLTPPIFDRQHDLVVVSDHVRTRIYPPASEQSQEDGNEGFLNFRVRRAIVDYFPARERVPSRRVSHDELLAMYYRNVAAEWLLDNDIDAAFRFAERALTIAPENASMLNIMAVIHRRGGDPETSEALLRHAVHIHPRDINLLHNLHALLDSQGHRREAAEILERLAALPDRNPYPRLMLARKLIDEGQLSRALNIYRAIIDQQPYIHEAYWGIAIVRQKQGDRDAAQNAMKAALERTQVPLHERRYSAKLQSLKSAQSSY